MSLPTSSDRRRFLQLSGAGLAALPLSASLARGVGPDAAPDTLFLTYHADPCTSITVQWLAPGTDPETVPVRFRRRGLNLGGPGYKGEVVATRIKYPLGIEAKGGGQIDHPPELQGVCRYRAEINGLIPGSEYEFQIASGKWNRFRTMPLKQTDSFSFITGGDCATNEHCVANNRVAARQDPMFAVVGGDLGYDNGRSAATSVKFIRNYATTMIDSEGRLIPMIAILGNHEVSGSYSQPRANAPFFWAFFDGLYKDATYATLDFGDYLSLVLLDTQHVSPIAGAQTEFLQKSLAARVGRDHLLVVNHVPAYPSYREAGMDDPDEGGTGAGNRKHWVPLFERYQVDAVLEHHDHTFKRTHFLKDGSPHPGGILYLGDGSWGQLRPAKTPEERPYLAVSRSDYHLTLHRLEGKERYHLALGETGKVLDLVRGIKRTKRG